MQKKNPGIFWRYLCNRLLRVGLVGILLVVVLVGGCIAENKMIEKKTPTPTVTQAPTTMPPSPEIKTLEVEPVIEYYPLGGYTEKKREALYIFSGGPVAVSTAVEQKVAEMGDVKRIFGETRVETAVALAEEAYPNKNNVRVIVITDYENPKIDAVLMSYVLDAPLLYVKSDSLSP
ncbi:MAG: cell wall-binding repeat-containing protein [Candidatus Hydrothermarchaeales archaeon]